ncbi:MAG: M28 family peptidase [Acidobacteria bacterium]|nr:M28 family peptidase [Acidobacteriota bacterium]
MYKKIHVVLIAALLLFNCSGGGTKSDIGDLKLESGHALLHVRRLVEFGPRAVGSEGHGKAIEYIQSELRKLPLEVEAQRFDAITPKGTLSMENIIARQQGGHAPVIILASHYDTMATDRFSFVGANDGGSSSGLLLELARVLAPRKSEFQYWFVFFDGEEAMERWTDSDSLYGSRQFVKELKMRRELVRVKALVLMDMVGDKNLNIKRDLYSTAWVVDLFWTTAAMGRYSGFVDATLAILDDHIPFLQEGIPAVDLIDYDFGPDHGYWHTAEDTLDKISADSLRQVGDVVLKTLPVLENAIKAREGK